MKGAGSVVEGGARKDDPLAGEEVAGGVGEGRGGGGGRGEEEGGGVEQSEA